MLSVVDGAVSDQPENKSAKPTAVAEIVHSEDELPVNVSLAVVDDDNDPTTLSSHRIEPSTLLPNVVDSDELNDTEKLAFSESEDEFVEQNAVSNPSTATAAAADGVYADEDDDVESAIRQHHKRMRSLLDSDDDDDDNDNGTAKITTSTSADTIAADKVPHKKPISKLDSSSGDDEKTDDDDGADGGGKTVKRFSKKSATSALQQLCDGSSSSEDEDYAPAKEHHADAATAVAVVPAARPPKRASARDAEDQMKTIQSESQRLAREQSISVPYHRPKQHTLQAFLSRRRVIRPADVRPDRTKAAASIKMTGEQLEEYARNLEERAKDAQLFYKSDDTEPENERDQADNADGVEQLPTASIDEQQPSASTVEQSAVGAATDSTNEADGTVVSGTPPPVVQPTRLELLRERVRAQLTPGNGATASPALKGSANTMIDLDSGAVFPSPVLSGASELYQRYLQHSNPRNPKLVATTTAADTDSSAPVDDEPSSKIGQRSMQVMSAGEDGRVTIDTIVLPPSSSAEPSIDAIRRDSKPRSLFYKLKDALGQKLAQKRREDLEERIRMATPAAMESSECYGGNWMITI